MRLLRVLRWLEPAMGSAKGPRSAAGRILSVSRRAEPWSPHCSKRTPAPDGCLCRTNFSADLTQQLDVPLQFVDFLREPEVDANTGEVTNEHPSYYESVQGGLPDIKCVSCFGLRIKG